MISLPKSDVSFLVKDRLSGAGTSFLASGLIACASVAVYRWANADRISDLDGFQARAVFRRAATMVVSYGLLAIAAVTIPGPDEISESGDAVSLAAEVTILWVTLIWVSLFIVSMVWYALRWTFGVSDVHPVLGPAVTAMTAVAAAIIGEVIDLNDPRPNGLRYVLVLCALVSVLIVAGCEAFYVRRATRPS